MKAKLRSTKKQRDELRQCHPGVGFIIWNNGCGVSEVDVFIHSKTKQLCYISTGKPASFDFVVPEDY